MGPNPAVSAGGVASFGDANSRVRPRLPRRKALTTASPPSSRRTRLLVLVSFSSEITFGNTITTFRPPASRTLTLAGKLWDAMENV